MTTTNDTTGNADYFGYAKDVAFVISAQILVALLQFLRLPILTKWLGASLYGTWSIIWVTVTFIMPLASLGLGMAMVRFLAAEKDTARIRDAYLSIVSTAFAAGMAVSLLLIIFARTSDIIIPGNTGNTGDIALASFMILTQSLSQTSIAFFRTFRQMLRYSIFMTAHAAIQVGLMAFFLWSGWQLTGAIIAVLVSDILCFVVAFGLALRQIGFQFPKFTHLPQYLKYGLPLVPSSIALWIINSSDRYVLGYFMEARDVGIYSAAYTLSHVISLFLGPIKAVLLPTVSKSYDNGDIAGTKNYFKYTLKYSMLLSIPAAFGMSVLAVPLIRILTTPEFVTGSAVLPLVASGFVIFELYSIGSYIFYLVKKTQWILWLLIITAILNVTLTILLVPHLGIIGAGLASLIAYAVSGILTISISFRYFKFDLNFFFLLKSISASGVMSGVIWLIHPETIIQVTLAIGGGAIIYFSLMLIMRSFSRSELRLFKEILAKCIIRKQ